MDEKQTNIKVDIDVPLVTDLFFFPPGPFGKPLLKVYFNKNRDFFKSLISCNFS